MVKKKNKGKNYSANEVKRYLGALHEEHLDALKGIGEGYDAINQRLDRHEEKLDSHTEMIGQLMVDMTEVKTRLKRIEGANLERRVKILEQSRQS